LILLLLASYGFTRFNKNLCVALLETCITSIEN
jgi:hypothetical protein